MKRFLILAGLFALAAIVYAQGPLTPPTSGGNAVGRIPPIDGTGNPQSSMKTLHQIEPGVDLATVPTLTITEPGPYILSEDSAGIVTIEASNVTLDLRGFAVFGVNVRNPGDPPVDVPVTGVRIRNGSVGGGGISTFQTTDNYTENGLIEDVQVRGQTSGGSTQGVRLGEGWTMRHCVVSGFRGRGITGLRSCTIENCRSVNNGQMTTMGGSGITLGNYSRIIDCKATDNAAHGFEVDDECIVTGSIAIENGESGITTGYGARVSDCATRLNSGHGITIKGGVISACTARGNSGNGIDAVAFGRIVSSVVDASGGIGINSGTGCVITDCAVSNSGDGGIIAGERTRVSGCTVYDNTAWGITVGDDSTVQDCSSTKNNGGGISVGGHAIVRGSTACNNSESGFKTGITAVVSGCTADSNGTEEENSNSHGFQLVGFVSISNCVSVRNEGNGIHVTGSQCRIDGNTVRQNKGLGVNMAANNNTVIRNVIDLNTGGELSHTGGDVAPVSPAASATNPFSNLQ